MKDDKHREFQIDPRVKDFYLLAEDFDQVDTSELNPSLHSLKSVQQRYQSHKLIAEGGMKEIFKVTDARAKRKLAMAMLRSDAPEDLYDPFIHEAWLTALLAHPNIMTIHDIGVNPYGKPYFTMDLKKGDSLGELIAKLHAGDQEMLQQYSREELLQIFLKICDAMAYAHSIGVLHLDLKPANIQIGEFGQVLVCDWGMGKVQGREDLMELDRQLLNPDLLSSITLYGELKGTPGCMAPEQVLKKEDLDVRTDVYGLGCILYSLLTFLQPISGTDTQELLKKTRDGEIIEPVLRAPEQEVPKALNAVVMKALEVDPDQRYASVAELRQEVNRYLTGFATKAEKAGLLTQMQLFFLRNKLFCITVSISITIGLIGATWAFVQLSQKERATDEARQEAERTLALYQTGQGELKELGSRYDDSVKTVVRKYKQMGNYAAANRVLLAALAEEPENPVYLYEKGLYHFTLQQFNAAVNEFDRSGVRDDVVLVRIAGEYACLKEDTVLLSSQQMVDLIERLPTHTPLIYRMIQFDQRERLNLTQRAIIIHAFLKILNPDWADPVFEYNLANGRLKLGGRGLSRIHMGGSLLAGLQPRGLDISGTDIASLGTELSYPIETLNIIGTPFFSKRQLRSMVHLRDLTVSQAQYDELKLHQLPKRIAVNVID